MTLEIVAVGCDVNEVLFPFDKYIILDLKYLIKSNDISYFIIKSNVLVMSFLIVVIITLINVVTADFT